LFTNLEAFDIGAIGNLLSISGSERLLAEVAFNCVSLKEIPSIASIDHSDFDPR
jgi:hypothetical protein